MSSVAAYPPRPPQDRLRPEFRLALVAALGLLSVLGYALPTAANTVTNDPIPVGTFWGNPTESPGDPMFTEDSISLTI